MRLVSWNCAGGFQRKVSALERLLPDLAIVCEVHARALAETIGASALWTGSDAKGKGLALIGWRGWELTQVYAGPLPNVLAAHARRGEEELLLTGVWTVPASRSYTLPLIALCEDEKFRALLQEWKDRPVVVAGDFNANDVFRKSRPYFPEVREKLHSLGLRSLWHERSGDEYGSETRPTYYYHWNEEKPFHIDYMFASLPLQEACQAFEIGRYDDWTLPRISDHLPLVGEFGLMRKLA